MVAIAPKSDTKIDTLHWSSAPSRYGACVVIATNKGICWAGTPGTSAYEGFTWAKRHLQAEHIVEGEKIAPLSQAMEELRRYLAGEHVQFTCPLDLRGTTFQIAVWEELFRIPYGQTRTYTEIAQAIGRPSAVRAVGAANGANPIVIIVPCHRVIGSNGTLTGYGGGLPTKQWLLSLEGISMSR